MSAATRSVAAGLLAMVFVACPPTGAAEFNMQVTSAAIKPGSLVSGPALATKNLANRVVLLEFWGLNCPPCIRSMPMLEELHKTLGPLGLTVIGAHAQGGSAEELRPKVAQLGVTFTVLDGANVDGAMDFQGIPHCMLFDHTGKCIYRGSPFQAQQAVVTAVRAAPGAVLEGRVLAKLPELNTLLRDESEFGAALKRARGMTANKDEALAAEATFVVEKLEAHGRRMLDEAASAKDADPAQAAELVQRCSAVFKGSDLGTEASKLAAAWRKDKKFQAAVKAGQQLTRLERMRAYVIDQLGGQPDDPVTAEMAAAVPPALKKQIAATAEGVERACPGSPMAQKAARIAGEFAGP